MAQNGIPAFNSPKASPYRALYNQSMAKAKEAAESSGAGPQDQVSIQRSSENGVKTSVSLETGTVVINEPDAPIIDDYVHALVLNDSSRSDSRLVRQNATMVMKPGPNGTLMVTEKAINYVGDGSGSETARSTWTRNLAVDGEIVADRMFYTPLQGARLTPR